MSELDRKTGNVPGLPDDDEDIEILEIVGLDEGPAVQFDDAGVESDDDPGELILDFDADGESDQQEAVDEERARRVRLAADFENYKKRVEREREADQRQASVRVVQSLLPVLDNFERAIAAATAEEAASSFYPGVLLIFRQIRDELRREGLLSIDAVGQPFDPAFHEAVATEEQHDLPHHTIMEEMQRGYTLHERLLRPSLVKVRTQPGMEDTDPGNDEGA